MCSHVLRRTKLLTLRAVGVGLGVREAPLASFTTTFAAGKNLVHATVLCLHVLDLHHVFEAVDGAAEVNFPDGRI